MKPRRYILSAFCVFLLVVLIAIGVTLARQKPLWNDEIYSQIASVQNISYFQIMDGRVAEGNNCPLFYIVQKLLCDATHYQWPYVWKGGEINDAYAQVLLRLAPILAMSMSIVIVFYFFTMVQGWLMGAYAVLLFCSSFIVWGYMAEARPYALWVSLTVLQMIVLYKSLQAKENLKDWKRLSAVHIALSLTSVFGALQAMLGAFLLGIGQRRTLKQGWGGVLLAPLALGLFYSWRSPKYIFRVGDMAQLILDNMSLDRIIVIGAYLICILAFAPWRKTLLRSAENYCAFFCVGLLLASLLLISYHQSRHVQGTQGFELASRYFMNLVPVSALTIAFAVARALREFAHDRWAMLNIHLAMVGLIAIEAMRTYTYLTGFYQW